MRTRVVITVIAIAVAILVLIFSFRSTAPTKTDGSQRTAQNIPSISDTVSGTQTQRAERAHDDKPPGRPATDAGQSPANADMGKQELSNIMDQWIARFNEDFRWPIAFYGKVLDERGNPVSEARAHFSWTMPYPNEPGNLHTKSDSNGLFSLTGATGRTLNVGITKSGYYTVKSNQTQFEYSQRNNGAYHLPDANNSAIFYLHKKGPGADLITSQYGVFPYLEFSTPRDGSPVRVNFLTRKIENNGQMEIICIKPTRGEDRSAKEWLVQVSIPDGGFILQNDEFPFEAPEGGYQSTIKFHFKPGESNWTDTLRGRYYIVFGQARKYGRIDLETGAYWGVRLNYAINPDGSRYLEPKEKQYQPRPPSIPGAVEVIPKLTE